MEQYRICPRRHNIWPANNPVEVLNEHLSVLVGRYVPTKVIRVCNKDKPLFDDQCRHAFGLKLEAHLRWTRDRSRVNWEEFGNCQVRANKTYTEAKRLFSDRNRDVLMNVQSPHTWWSTLKSAVFGSSLVVCGVRRGGLRCSGQLCSVGIGGSVLSILTVSIKPITAYYGGWLSE